MTPKGVGLRLAPSAGDVVVVVGNTVVARGEPSSFEGEILSPEGRTGKLTQAESNSTVAKNKMAHNFFIPFPSHCGP